MNDVDLYTPLSGQIVLVDYRRKICAVIISTVDIPAEHRKYIYPVALGIEPPDYVYVSRKVFFNRLSITGIYNRRKEAPPKTLQSIGSVACVCSKCNWQGCVYDCEPDVDNDGSLGCPECLTIIDV